MTKRHVAVLKDVLLDQVKGEMQAGVMLSQQRSGDRLVLPPGAEQA